ncbi:MAG: multiheme c-type cytochrome [Planctomycetota bacterium]
MSAEFLSSPPPVPESGENSAGGDVSSLSGLSKPEINKRPEAKKPSATKKRPQHPIGKRLRPVLYVVLTLFGVLSANGLYLSGVTFTEWWNQAVYQNRFYQWMFLVHLALGLLLITPVVGFGWFHMLRSRHRRNRRAVKIGYALFAASIVILVSGLLLMRVGSFAIVDPASRNLVYILHIAAPIAAVWLYCIHRLVGPRIKWRVGRRVMIAITTFVAIMVSVHTLLHEDTSGGRPESGEQYFAPSLARTASGEFIDERVLMNDEYCLRCHEDIFDSFVHSAHKLSSFNNPAYRASVRETRQVASRRDGTVQSSRWCAGCHDPVPFFSGKFDNPDYDDVDDPTAHAGITCVVCHAIESVDGHVGNAAYTIDAPEHYPFANSDNALLRKISDLMVKAKPSFHKTQMLKPFHKTAEFCSTCHKVSLPKEVTGYREFLRGQNHYDSYLLSGVSGHGCRSFYYPATAQTNCNGCHMRKQPSTGFGAKYDETLGTLAIANHGFPSGNTALAHWTNDDEQLEAAKRELEGSLRVDLFGLRVGAGVDDPLIAPLGSTATVMAGSDVLIETVLRTMTLGHHFTQGTSDSNQIWIEITVSSDAGPIAQSGHRDPREVVDPNSHFVNTFMLDRDGKRINRRNAQDIFTPLYSHQIPPGAGQTVHYRLSVPDQVGQKLRVTARALYRKFDTEYLDYIRADRDPVRDLLQLGAVGDPNDLPIIELGSDSLDLEIVSAGGDTETQTRPLPADQWPETDDDGHPTWQRVNDYGIGLLLSGRSQWKQAAEVFAWLETSGRYDGPLNLARVQFSEGDLDAASSSLARAAAARPAPPSWTSAWLSGTVNRQQGNLEAAERSLRVALDTRIPERKFDFSLDYVVANELGMTLVDRAQAAEVLDEAGDAKALYQEAADVFEGVLEIDSENAIAHSNLAQIRGWQGDADAEALHRAAHERYKQDDSAAEIAVPAGRQRYPAANRAAEAVVIYELE